MTEAEWLACTDPVEMLAYLLERKASDRKLRLFACLCCRQSWRRFTDERSQKAVEAAEAFAEGQVSRQGLDKAFRAADAARKEATTNSRQAAAWVAMLTTLPYDQLATNDLTLLPSWAEGRSTRRAAQQCHFLRDLFGPLPFGSLAFDPRWANPTVVNVAQAIYEGRRFQDMPILSDALEETGCTDQEILQHCRGPGPHTRGCWLLDLVSGKE